MSLSNLREHAYQVRSYGDPQKISRRNTIMLQPTLSHFIAQPLDRKSQKKHRANRAGIIDWNKNQINLQSNKTAQQTQQREYNNTTE